MESCTYERLSGGAGRPIGPALPYVRSGIEVGRDW
jgi:hypothetical protein